MPGRSPGPKKFSTTIATVHVSEQGIVSLQKNRSERRIHYSPYMYFLGVFVMASDRRGFSPSGTNSNSWSPCFLTSWSWSIWIAVRQSASWSPWYSHSGESAQKASSPLWLGRPSTEEVFLALMTKLVAIWTRRKSERSVLNWILTEPVERCVAMVRSMDCCLILHTVRMPRFRGIYDELH